MAIELAKAYVQIVPSAEGIGDSLDDVMNGAGESAGRKAGLNIASTIKKLIIAAGIGKVFKESLMEGANIQQSFGGLDTIYDSASESLKKYSMQAYAAGISANTYAEQAVSFGASLRQAFGGDTAKAAEAANTAIMDMADNAAKMGTPIEQIQTAYQGFAKGQYQLLDNLKLGYGGTKGEMERLLADAQAITGVEYDIDNLGDVYEAIHVIQGELGVTGVAAEEAKTTLSGSFGAMKAAAQTAFGAWATGMDVAPAFQNLAQTVSTFIFGNLIPSIGKIALALPTGIASFVKTAVPLLMENVGNLIRGLTDFLTTKAPELIPKGAEMIANFITGLVEGLPDLISSGGGILENLANGIAQNIPIILSAGWTIISALASAIFNNLPQLASSGASVVARVGSAILQNLPQILSTGIQLIGKLVAGIISAIPNVIRTVPQIVRGIKQAFSGINWGDVGRNIISGIARGLTGAAGAIMNAAKSAAQSALQSAKNVLGIHSPSRVFEMQVGRNISLGMAKGIEGEGKSINSAVRAVSDSSINNVSVSYSAKAQNSGNDALTQILDVLNAYLPLDRNVYIDGNQVGKYTYKAVDSYQKADALFAQRLAGASL